MSIPVQGNNLFCILFGHFRSPGSEAAAHYPLLKQLLRHCIRSKSLLSPLDSHDFFAASSDIDVHKAGANFPIHP